VWANLSRIDKDMTQTKTPRKGATEPRLHSPYLKGENKGDQIAELAESIGYPLLPWQDFVIRDMTTVDDDGMFIRKTNLILCSRQQGKTHLARMMMLGHMFLFDSPNVLIMSSNRSMALDTFRQVAYAIEGSSELSKQVRQIRYANGTESIELKNGHRLDVVAATRDGSRGRTASFLYIDEIREISEEGFRAATPTTRAKPNAQTLLTSNAGDNFSTVLNSLVERARSTPPKSFGYYEYSAPPFAKITDRAGWAMANPALGYTVTEESLEEAVATQPIETTKTEMLCQWISSTASPWPHMSVEDAGDKDLKLVPGPLTIFAFDVSPSRRDGSLVMGQVLPDGRIGVAVLETFHSDVSIDELFVANAIAKWAKIYYPRMVCYDKYTTASIAKRLEVNGIQIVDISGQKGYQASGDLYESLANKRLVHSGQDALVTHMANCAAKESPDSWRIVRRKSAGPVDIAIGLSMVVHILNQPMAEAKVYV
jgi:phage terminase large subunit-like protein